MIIVALVLACMLLWTSIRKKAYKYTLISLVGMAYFFVTIAKDGPAVTQYGGMLSLCSNTTLVLFCILVFWCVCKKGG